MCNRSLLALVNIVIVIDTVLQVMVAALVHLKDEHCTAESHVFSQFVRTPHHKPHDMKVGSLLYLFYRLSSNK